MKLQQKDIFSNRWHNVVMRPQRESQMQIELVDILKWAIKPTVLWFHIPSGELRDKSVGQKLKAMGAIPGQPDLQFHWIELDGLHRKIRRVLHLELKVGNRPRSEAQVAFALTTRLLGDNYFVVRSVDAAIVILGNLGLIRPDVEVCGRRW